MRVALFWGFYAAYNGGFLQTFRDNQSVLSSGVKQYLIFENGTVGCRKTSITNYHSALCKFLKDHISCSPKEGRFPLE